MILYHGSPKAIETPLYGYGSKENDYGLGFYCTQSNDLAKEWACPTVQSGFSNKYELDMDGLRVLHLNSDGYHILNWIAILLQNRIFAKRSPVARQANSYILNEFLPDISGYDVVIGYRADDPYFSYAKDFLNNTISVNQLSQAMKLGELGEQVVLKSEKHSSRFILRVTKSRMAAFIIPAVWPGKPEQERRICPITVLIFR